MRDPVFVGKDVAEAVRLASRTLCLPEAGLRYVVLEQEQPGGRGLSATGARIAVLIEKAGQPAGPDAGSPREAPNGSGDEGHRRRRQGRVAGDRAETGSAGQTDAASGIRELLREFARVAEEPVTVEVAELRDIVEVQIGGPGARAFFDPKGQALEALEHVIERSYGRELSPRRIRVRCDGYREYREGVLRERALELAHLVQDDGQARTTEPLNSYERRLIHTTLDSVEGVVTFSVGEGHDRRVTVAPNPGAPNPGAPTPEAAAEPVTTPEAVVEPSSAPVLATIPAGEDEPREEQVMPVVANEAEAPAAPETAAPVVAPAFDYRQYDRPPAGRSGAPELM